VIIAEGWKYGRTYCVPLRTENPWISDKYNGDGHAGMVAVTYKMWHRRLGHISWQSLQQLCTMVDGLAIKDLPGKVSSDFCETCVKGKMTKFPFNGSRAPTSRILERIHSDLCGPIPQWHIMMLRTF